MIPLPLGFMACPGAAVLQVAEHPPHVLGPDVPGPKLLQQPLLDPGEQGWVVARLLHKIANDRFKVSPPGWAHDVEDRVGFLPKLLDDAVRTVPPNAYQLPAVLPGEPDRVGR